MKLIFILLLLSSILNAIPITNIDTNNTKLQDFKLEYFVDKTLKMNLKEVEKQTFKADTSRLSLGIFKDVAWLRFKLHNETNSSQKLYIHSENAYVANAINFYELLDEKIVNELHIDFKNNEDTESRMFGSDAIFVVNLKINQFPTETF